jgi:hypothetical protein
MFDCGAFGLQLAREWHPRHWRPRFRAAHSDYLRQSGLLVKDRRGIDLPKNYAASVEGHLMKVPPNATVKRMVHLPGGRQLSLSTYIQAWKRALAPPPGTIFQSAFNWYPESREEILSEFRRGLHDRINRRCQLSRHTSS